MRTITQIINENKTTIKDLHLKPIHLFKPNGYYQDYYQQIIDKLQKEWPAALQDSHEDEYMCFEIDKWDSEQENCFDIIWNYLNNKCKCIDGISTRGIGANFRGWSQYKFNNKSIFVLRQGTDKKLQNNKYLIKIIIFADEDTFKYIIENNND